MEGASVAHECQRQDRQCDESEADRLGHAGLVLVFIELRHAKIVKQGRVASGE